MKVPSRKIMLAEKLDPGYGDYFFSMPRSLLEGTLHQIQLRNLEIERLSARSASETDPDKSKVIESEELEFRRESNAVALDLIEEWNLTGKDEKILPLPRTAKTAEKKLEIMSQLPIEVIGLIGTEIWNAKPVGVSEETADFSNASSVEQGEGN